MLKLKLVVDKQRDELRAKAQEITTISKEVEAVKSHTLLHLCALTDKNPQPVCKVALAPLRTHLRLYGFKSSVGCKATSDFHVLC